MVGTVYPIGWSPREAFAYALVVDVGGGCLCYRYKIIIQDLVIDTIL